MTRLLLFYSIAVAVIISSFCQLCSGGWSQSVEPQQRTKILYSARVAWAPSHSHFRIQYKVFTSPSSLRISYSQECARWGVVGQKAWWQKKYGWIYKKSEWIDMNLNLDPSQATKAACSQLFDKDQPPKGWCKKFRLKIRIQHTNEQVDHLELTDTCNFGETRYTADCNFDNGDSCGYRNDLCSLTPWKIDDNIEPLRDVHTPQSCSLLSQLDMEVLQPPEFESPFDYKEPEYPIRNDDDDEKDFPDKEMEEEEEEGYDKKKKRSVESIPETRIAKSASNDYYLYVDGRAGGRKIVATAIVNSPNLTRHEQFNSALQFGYRFEHSGVHYLFIALVCLSDAGRLIPLRDDSTHFKLVNGKEQREDLADVTCLDIHTFLKGCEQFQVRFVGAARGSRLTIDDIHYSSNCPSGRYDNR